MKAKAARSTGKKPIRKIVATKHGWSVVYDDGKATSVIIGIRKFQRILDRLDDLDDIEYLDSLKGKPQEFISLEEFLAKHKRP